MLISPEVFDELMQNHSCSCCGSAHEPPFQGGILTQKVNVKVNDNLGVGLIYHTVCSNCLEMLQSIADVRDQQEKAAQDSETDVGNILKRKPDCNTGD